MVCIKRDSDLPKNRWYCSKYPRTVRDVSLRVRKFGVCCFRRKKFRHWSSVNRQCYSRKNSRIYRQLHYITISRFYSWKSRTPASFSHLMWVILRQCISMLFWNVDYEQIKNLFLIHNLHFKQISIYILPEDDPHDTLETCWSPNVLILKTSYYNIVHLLVCSWILTVSATIYIFM